MSDPFNLQRFLDAQESVWPDALAEMKAGRKRSHWIWFVFPQMRGLGLSPNSEFYGIASLDEAQAYLAHPVLEMRLATIVEAVLAHEGKSANAIFGSPDDMKLRSSMTLFDTASGDGANPYRAVLRGFFDGVPDPRTLALLGKS
ncbi:Calpastatin [Hyphomicrobiales bacterium]|nr:Calpastatin [Hyphomicrobiales bacterium]CAH1698453.1 Calpastatin [Hyphomicrobiales bacterium]CAI0342103.1 Calpastatin [Hyphomicrobiales bacterium]